MNTSWLIYILVLKYLFADIHRTRGFFMQIAKSYIKEIYIYINKWKVLFCYRNFFPKQIYFIGTYCGRFYFALKQNKIA